MDDADLQALCERGAELLVAMRYIEAEAAYVEAEAAAWTLRDFDTLARLYMPLQEARRQRRQRCGEGVVHLHLIAREPGDVPSPERIVEQYPHGQLLVAGWNSVEPAVRVRELQIERRQYAETFLARSGPGERVVIVPLLGDAGGASVEVAEADLPAGPQPGTDQTYAKTMDLWERLHAPFLAAADAAVDPFEKIELYRRAIRVDYACELAHQRLSQVAARLARGNPS